MTKDDIQEQLLRMSHTDMLDAIMHALCERYGDVGRYEDAFNEATNGVEKLIAEGLVEPETDMIQVFDLRTNWSGWVPVR